jgi:hypothetical protein
MEFLLGILAFLQQSVLPGFLAAYAFRLGRVAPGIPMIFAISLISNHVLVVGLVLAGEYTRPSLVIIVLAELFLLAYLVWARGDLAHRWSEWPIWAPLAKEGRSFGRRLALKPARSLVEMTAVLFSVYVIAAEFAAAVGHAGDGFDSWDAIQSWNRWAVDWASGSLPHSTYHYPQLLPTNWSISYVLTNNTELTLFSSSLDRFFLPMLLYVLAWYSLRERRPLLMLAVPLCARMFRVWLYGFVDGAYADVPVAFFSIASALVLLAPPRLSDGAAERTLQFALSAILAFGAASTKQAGVQWLLLTFPILVFMRSSTKRDFGVSTLHAAIAVCVLVLCSLAWYAYARYQIYSGAMVSEIGYVTHDIYEGVGPLERVAKATAELGFLLWFSLVGTVFALADKRYRLLALCGAIPYFFIWAAYFSYDNRNVAIAIPFLSLTAVVGWLAVSDIPMRHLQAYRTLAAHAFARGKVMRLKIAAIPTSALVGLMVALSVPLLAVAARHYSLPRLMERQSDNEVENLFGRNAAPYGHALVATIKDATGPVQIWSADRYTCLLTVVRSHSRCSKLETEGQFREVLQKSQSDGENAALMLVAPLRFRASLLPLATAKSITFVESGNGFDLWSSRMAP